MILQNLTKIDDPATGRLSHVLKDESFSGLDPIKPKPKYKRPAYEHGQGIFVLGVKQLHVRYRLEHALEPLRSEKEQRSRNPILKKPEPNYNSPALISNTLHQLTFDSPVSTSDTGFKEQTLEGLPSTLSHHISLQTETIPKISTLNSHLYDPGSVDSARSTPTESLSTTSSPVLQQAHPVLFPDSSNQGGRRSSVVSLDSTLPPSSPRPTNKKRGRQSVQPSQGDAVLISFLCPDQPLVAIRAGESPLPWPSGSESTETEMEGGSGGHDGESGGDSNHSSRSVSRKQSSEGLRGGGSRGSGDRNTTNGGSAAGGDGGGGGRKGNYGDGRGNKNGGGNGEEKNKEKERDKKKKKKAGKEQLASETDSMDIDEGSEEGRKTRSGQKVGIKDEIPAGRRDSNAMEVEVSSSETAVGGLMALAGAAGKDQQPPFQPGTTVLGLFPTTNTAPWAPTAHAQTSPGGTDRGPPPSPGPSNQLFQNNKLPLPNSPPPLPSMIPSMNTQTASSPNSLPPGNDGRHTTLPPVSSIHVLADIAEKESSHQQQSSRGYPNRMPPNSRTVYPTVSSHVSVAPSNRSAQAAQSPGLPPPGQAAHGYGPDGNPRPPMHHMTIQQRQYYMSQDSPTPYYPQHQHYHTAYPQIKEVSQGSPNNSGPYAPTFPNGRELPNIMSSPPPTGANFFAQTQNMPTTIIGRRDSTLESYYGSDPPSGPSTGETMPSSGTDDTVTSPRHRTGMPIGMHGGMQGGMQGGSLAAGVFKCEFAGCKAQAFQTQYLLK
ncbi:hypothetical protein Q9L58_002689 [Maublancomyces gigas]|uniref:Mixed-lineage leukemia-like protein n=1 Tax=Discina gigas TaxID=1032678 RepID=A0ABR3GQQ2_9PEZI